MPRGGRRRLAIVAPAAVVTDLPRLTPVQLADAAAGGAPGVLRRQLLADLAARALGVDRAAIRLTAHGVRRLVGTRYCASVAARAGWVAAAVGPRPLGVDVETIAEAGAARDVVLAGVVGVADLGAWHGLAGVWAAKEASLKALGRDLTTAPAAWAFGARTVAIDGIVLTIDLQRCGGAVAAVAYVGD